MKPCPHCGGTGHVRSDSSVALHVVRAIEEFLLKDSRSHITVKTPAATALYVLNHKRSTLVELERRFGVTITRRGRRDAGRATLRDLPRRHRGKAGSGMPDPLTALPSYPEPEDPRSKSRSTRKKRQRRRRQPAERAPHADADGQADHNRDRKRRRRRRRRGGKDREPGAPHEAARRAKRRWPSTPASTDRKTRGRGPRRRVDRCRKLARRGRHRRQRGRPQEAAARQARRQAQPPAGGRLGRWRPVEPGRNDRQMPAS